MNRAALLVLACFAACAAFAQDAPKRKSGLWEVSMSSPQMPTPMVTRQCVDEKTDDMSKGASRGGAEKCSKQSVRREGGNVVVESVCQIEGSTATTRGVFSGDFKTSYKGELTTRFAPPLHGTAETKMNFQARHAGACPPGQKGGNDARRMMEEMQRKYGKQ